jgi:hypothetical protein
MLIKIIPLYKLEKISFNRPNTDEDQNSPEEASHITEHELRHMDSARTLENEHLLSRPVSEPKMVKSVSKKRQMSLNWLYTPLWCFKYVTRLDAISFFACVWTIFFYFYEDNCLCRYAVVWAMVVTPVYLINMPKIGWLCMLQLLIVLVDYIINTIDSTSSNWIFDTTVGRFAAVPVSFMVEYHSTITEMLGLGQTFKSMKKSERWASEQNFSFENHGGQMADYHGFRYGAFDMLLVCLFFKGAMYIDGLSEREYKRKKLEESSRMQELIQIHEEARQNDQFEGQESIVSAVTITENIDTEQSFMPNEEDLTLLMEKHRVGSLSLLALIGYSGAILTATMWTWWFNTENVFGLAGCGHISLILTYLVWGIYYDQFKQFREYS